LARRPARFATWRFANSIRRTFRHFLTIARAEANLTISDLINGVTDPSVITLNDAKLVIRHSRDGHLLTRFPKPAASDGPMPEIRLRNSIVTVQREGEPDCTFQGIDLVAREDAGRLIMTGSATDPNWGGEWQAAGTVALDGSSVVISVATKGVHITPEVLRRVPYVSPKIWTHFAADGDTPVKLQLALGRPGEKVRYRVDLNPTNTKIYVPSIDLNAEQATGQVVVEDNWLRCARFVAGWPMASCTSKAPSWISGSRRATCTSHWMPTN